MRRYGRPIVEEDQLQGRSAMAQSRHASVVHEASAGLNVRFMRSSFRRGSFLGGSMADAHTGACFCGAVEIEVTGPPIEMGYCHCKSCRSYSGAPVSAYSLWKSENIRVIKGMEFLGRFKKTE